jgi:hypothetical protein
MRFLNRDGLNAVVWSLVLWGMLSLILVYQFLPSRVRLRVGEVSSQDVRAPQKITYISEIRTEKEREAAASAVRPIYSLPDRLLAQRQVSRAKAIARYIDLVRQDKYSDKAEKRRLLAAIQDVSFSPEAIDLCLEMQESQWRTVVDQAIAVLGEIMRREVREDQLEIVRAQVPTYINVNLTTPQARIVNEWVQGLIVPNSFVDEERTQAAREKARQAVEPVRVTFERGQTVIREGEVVTDLDVEALQALGLQRTESTLGTIISVLLYVLLLVIVLTVYIARRQPHVLRDPRLATLLIVLITAFTLAAKLAVPGSTILPYFVPVAAVSMLVGSLIGPDLALVVTAVLVLLVGSVSGGSLELITYGFVSGALAALMVWRVERLNTFIWTGVLVSITNLAVVLVFALINQNTEVRLLLTLGVASLVSGAIAASVTLIGFFVFGNLLQVTTFLQLMELARPTYPLLQKVLVEAPGTYHHTILVSNLTERAAQDVGADPLLARVGAYYHDVGKTLQPYYFTENQLNGVNIHERLDPKTSAQIIISHVKEGITLAEKYGLPKTIIDFIPQHHGTRLVTYFYHEACERYGKENVDKADYRYPGPKPQTREAAILMLADSVQAIAQAERPDGPEQIDEIVRGVINQRLAEGQLDECNLTLRDLSTIRRSFVDILQGIYHDRIKYPIRDEIPAPAEGTVTPRESADTAAGQDLALVGDAQPISGKGAEGET